MARDELVRDAWNDIESTVPILQAISELRSILCLDREDEYRVDFLFSLIAHQAESMLGLLALLNQEVDALYAYRQMNAA